MGVDELAIKATFSSSFVEEVEFEIDVNSIRVSIQALKIVLNEEQRDQVNLREMDLVLRQLVEVQTEILGHV